MLTTKSIGGEEYLRIGPLDSQFSFYFRQIKPIHDNSAGMYPEGDSAVIIPLKNNGKKEKYTNLFGNN